MAEEKKDAKPGKPADKGAPAEKDDFVEIVWLLFALFIGFYLLQKLLTVINAFLSGDIGGTPLLDRLNVYLHSLLSLIPYLKIFAVIVCIAVIYGIVYLYKKLSALRGNEKQLFYPEVTSKTESTNPHWERILTHIESLNENDWRLAIIEADIMLSGILDKLYLPGDTMGEKLKAVEKSDFTTIDNAWEAHKIRNQIAHEGQDFELTQREGLRVIHLYKTVFEEFHVI